MIMAGMLSCALRLAAPTVAAQARPDTRAAQHGTEQSGCRQHTGPKQRQQAVRMGWQCQNERIKKGVVNLVFGKGASGIALKGCLIHTPTPTPTPTLTRGGRQAAVDGPHPHTRGPPSHDRLQGTQRSLHKIPDHACTRTKAIIHSMRVLKQMLCMCVCVCVCMP